MMQKEKLPGIDFLSYRLPKSSVGLDNLKEDSKLSSEKDTLRDFGFDQCFVENTGTGLMDSLVDSGKDTLKQAGLVGEDIKKIFFYSGLDGSFRDSEEQLLEKFSYPSSEVRFKLGLKDAETFALSQNGCTGLLQTIQIAGQLVTSGDDENILCLAGDRLPPSAKREVIFNLMSDATCSFIVRNESPKNRILSYYSHTQPYYWDTPKHEEEILASYFPLAKRVIFKALEKAGKSKEEVDWFVPHNVSLKSWEILAGLLGVSLDKIWIDNIARVGHTVACDHIINLVDMDSKGLLEDGQTLVLFTFGFGASWSCMVLGR